MMIHRTRAGAMTDRYKKKNQLKLVVTVVAISLAFALGRLTGWSPYYPEQGPDPQGMPEPDLSLVSKRADLGTPLLVKPDLPISVVAQSTAPIESSRATLETKIPAESRNDEAKRVIVKPKLLEAVKVSSIEEVYKYSKQKDGGFTTLIDSKTGQKYIVCKKYKIGKGTISGIGQIVNGKVEMLEATVKNIPGLLGSQYMDGIISNYGARYLGKRKVAEGKVVEVDFNFGTVKLLKIDVKEFGI